MKTRTLTGMALLIAMGTVAGVSSIPLAGARIFPVQHAINVLAAVLFGPGPAVIVAFCVAVLRNALQTGSPLAFPGGMIGALVAGLAYRATGRQYAAAIGEVFGTGVLGGLAAFPLARFILGLDVLAFTFIVPFTLSSVAGAVAGLIVLRVASAAWQKKTERA
ncbi:MAG: energy coupling factor transporter S component ThiW [Bacillota bacterium]|nr:energy coupling factor transporter S component ThiW [Bacillota bacterium]MDW7683649.1 energy coupling factor transporter S component ThiW [Bacillota bacterium]